MRKIWSMLIIIILTCILFFTLSDIKVLKSETLKENDFIYTINSDKTISIVSYLGKDKIIYVPSEIKERKVTSILSGAFSNLNEIRAVYIPESIEKIGENLFNEYNDLILYGTKSSAAYRYAINNKINFIAVNEFKINNLSTSLDSPQIAGNIIELNSNVSGGMGSLEYQYKIYKNAKLMWENKSDNNKVKWLPIEPGYYKIHLIVKDKCNSSIEKIINYEIKDEINIINFAPSLQSPQAVDTLIAIKSDAINVCGKVKYKYIFKKDGMIDFIRDYSEDNIVLWHPKEAGKYDITVMVCDEDNCECEKTISYNIEKLIEINDVEFNKASPGEVGSMVEINPDYSGGIGDIKVSYEVLKDDKVIWQSEGVINEDNVWVPNEGGLYKVYVEIEDSSGNIDKMSKKYYVQESLKITSYNVDVKSPQKLGKRINIVANAIGESDNINYSFIIKRGNREVFKQEYSRKNIVTWKPDVIGKYDIYIYATDGKETVSKKISNYSIIE